MLYAGEHVTIGRKVAIKFIREELSHGPHARDLLTEARAAGAIHHHGIIDIFGFGQQPGVGQYLVQWGLLLAKRGGKNAKKRATVAVEHKLVVLMHRQLIPGTEFELHRHEKPRTAPSG